MKATRDAAARWAALKPEVKRQWNQVTDEDFDSIKGNIERLTEVLRERHGFNRWDAEREIAQWSRSLAEASDPRAHNSV